MKIHGTAKGGAISHKDFGVAFGGGGGVPLVELFDTTTCNYNYNEGYSQLNGWSGAGVKFSGTNSTMTDFNKVVCLMSKKNVDDGFTGDLTLEIRDTDQTTVLVTGTSVNATELSTMPTYSEIVFTCDTTTVTAGQCIFITFPTGTNGNNCLFFNRSNSDNDCADPTYTGLYKTASVGTTNQLFDMVGYGNEQ